MIVGHACVAFALAAAGAARLGVARERAVWFGVVAGAFAVVPDVDMVYAAASLLQTDVTGVWAATAAFWDASKSIHRAVTHSLLLAAPAAVGFALAVSPRGRLLAAVPLGGLAVIGWAAEGTLAAVMLGLFAAAGVAVALGAAELGFDGRAVLLAAVVGLGTHPFGDIFTGTPPPLVYPFEPGVFGDRVTLLADPTLNLLVVFALELAAVWLAVGAAAHLTGWSLGAAVDRRAGLGALYGAAAFVLPPPTLETSYHFVFSVLAVGSIATVGLAGRPEPPSVARAAVSGLAAVTLAAAAYGLVYGLA